MANRDPEPAYPHQQASADHVKQYGPLPVLHANDMLENQVPVEVEGTDLPATFEDTKEFISTLAADPVVEEPKSVDEPVVVKNEDDNVGNI